MHTKGPWKVCVSTDRFGWENYDINGGEIHDEDERQANARLIASAPELLEALEEIAEDAEYLDMLDIANTAREAVHKAT